MNLDNLKYLLDTDGKIDTIVFSEETPGKKEGTATSIQNPSYFQLKGTPNPLPPNGPNERERLEENGGNIQYPPVYTPQMEEQELLERSQQEQAEREKEEERKRIEREELHELQTRKNEPLYPARKSQELYETETKSLSDQLGGKKIVKKADSQKNSSFKVKSLTPSENKSLLELKKLEKDFYEVYKRTKEYQNRIKKLQKMLGGYDYKGGRTLPKSLRIILEITKMLREKFSSIINEKPQLKQKDLIRIAKSIMENAKNKLNKTKIQTEKDFENIMKISSELSKKAENIIQNYKSKLLAK
ncbi:MAG: hypothetical protein QXW79_00880 [Thermoplasmata archaeon]